MGIKVSCRPLDMAVAAAVNGLVGDANHEYKFILLPKDSRESMSLLRSDPTTHFLAAAAAGPALGMGPVGIVDLRTLKCSGNPEAAPHTDVVFSSTTMVVMGEKVGGSGVSRVTSGTCTW